MKDFTAFVTQDVEDVIRLMEDEEFSAWCDKNLSDGSLDKDDVKETGRRERMEMLLTKSHIYSLFTTSHCAK